MAQKRNSKSKSLQEKKGYFVITKDQFFIKLDNEYIVPDTNVSKRI